MIGLSILAISAAILAVQFKGMKSDFSMYIILTSSIVIIYYSLTRLTYIVEMIKNISEYTNVDEEYIQLLLKITGITYMTEFAANICADCGYTSISEQIRLFGKILVMAIAVPIINNLVEVIGEIYV